MTVEVLPTPNIPLLRKAVEWAEAEAAKPYPDRLWYQGDYAKETSCGTAFCIAGWTAANDADRDVEIRKDPCGCGDYDCDRVNVTLHIDGKRASFHEEGQDLLGLTEDEADALFDGGNEIEDVRRVAERIAARAGERL